MLGLRPPSATVFQVINNSDGQLTTDESGDRRRATVTRNADPPTSEVSMHGRRDMSEHGQRNHLENARHVHVHIIADKAVKYTIK